MFNQAFYFHLRSSFIGAIFLSTSMSTFAHPCGVEKIKKSSSGVQVFFIKSPQISPGTIIRKAPISEKNRVEENKSAENFILRDGDWMNIETYRMHVGCVVTAEISPEGLGIRIQQFMRMPQETSASKVFDEFIVAED